jgi:hypothetical protein
MNQNKTFEENKMSSAQPTIPPDDPKRSLAQLENLPHIGLVGDTYPITGHFCVMTCISAQRRPATAPA